VTSPAEDLRGVSAAVSSVGGNAAALPPCDRRRQKWRSDASSAIRAAPHATVSSAASKPVRSGDAVSAAYRTYVDARKTQGAKTSD